MTSDSAMTRSGAAPDQSALQQRPTHIDPLLTVQEAAPQLRKTERMLRWMISRGTAPKSALIGGRRMFRQSDIDAFIEAAFAEAS